MRPASVRRLRVFGGAPCWCLPPANSRVAVFDCLRLHSEIAAPSESRPAGPSFTSAGALRLQRGREHALRGAASGDVSPCVEKDAPPRVKRGGGKFCPLPLHALLGVCGNVSAACAARGVRHERVVACACSGQLQRRLQLVGAEGGFRRADASAGSFVFSRRRVKQARVCSGPS